MFRTRRAAALVCAALAPALTATAAPTSAGAAPPPKYKVDLFVSSLDRASFEEPGFPDRCKTWTQARSELGYEIEAKSPFNMALVRNPVTDSVYGLIPRDPIWMSDTVREWRTRLHVADNTSDCQPCGPSSEFGLCTGSLPDKLASDSCRGDGRRRRGALALTVTGSALTVAGGPNADLSGCTSPRDRVVPMFSGDPRLAPLRIPGATRKLLRLRVGQRARIEHTERRGDCKRLRGPGLRVCAIRYVLIRATRFG